MDKVSFAPIASMCFILLTSCGSPKVRNPTFPTSPQQVDAADGMVQRYIPAGEFLMGSLENDTDAEEDEKPQHTIYLDSYWIDQTEVTNQMYSACITDGDCTAPVSTEKDMREKPLHPVRGVSWYQAQNYCDWAGRHLPTEAEWEKAARGPEGRRFPWGDQNPDAKLANFNFVIDDIARVGNFPKGASTYEAYDMAGNVWEWVADWYAGNYYAESPSINPQGPSNGNLRVIRGGAWNTAENAIRSANRFWTFPGRDDFNGFRCAESNQE